MADNRGTLNLEVVSDTICPWCYIGKRRLDAALALIGSDIAFDVHWRPFELNPDMPPEGVERRAYRTRKFGSWAHSQTLDAQVQQAAESSGLAIHHERMTRTPNTVASHVLIQMAGESGRQQAVVEAIFEAYFTAGRDVGNPETLAEIAATCGLEHQAALDATRNVERQQNVRDQAAEYQRAGVSGVPTVILNKHLLFSGAQPPEQIAEVLRTAAAHPDVRCPVKHA